MAVATYPLQRRGMRHTIRKLWLPVLFLLPATVLMLVFMFVPMVNTLRISLESWNGMTSETWVGLGNYQDLLQDSLFYNAVAHTAIFVVVTVAFQTVIPLLVAVLVNS